MIEIFIVCFFISVVIYFLPTLIAKGRNNKNTLAICMLNIFLGWTLLGWVVALVWACLNSEQGD